MMNADLRLRLLLSLALFTLTACLGDSERSIPEAGGRHDVGFVDTGRDGFEIPDGGRPTYYGGSGYSGPRDAGGSSDATGDAAADTAPAECDDRRPCTAPFLCEDGRCVPECERDEDCGDDLCREFSCVERECAADDACPDPLAQVCDAGLCAPNPCNLHAFVFDPDGTTYTTVHVAGAFNADADGQWPETIADGGWPLAWDADLGVWYAKREIPNGAWEYKLVLDETTWVTDPANPDTVPDGVTPDGRNSVLTLDCAGAVSACGDLAAFDWRDAVMYFVMVDRFRDSDDRAQTVAGATGGDAATGPSGQYEGGDLPGVTERLDYLADLGVTALWLSAPYENRDAAGDAMNPSADPNRYSGYHGYWPAPADIDFSGAEPSPRPRVESRIGTMADLRELVDGAHGTESANGHGIKVLFDYVMNHVDADSGLYRAHPEWFAKRDGQTVLCGPEDLWNDPFWGTRCAFTDYLPPFDFTNAEARAWSVADATWWATELGIDGYRLDAIKHVPRVWLTDLRDALDDAIEDPAGDRFYLVGETFAYDDPGQIASYVDPETMLDGQFDFPQKARLCEALFSRTMGLDAYAAWLASNDRVYGEGAIMTTWIGNHDIPRAIHFASGEIGDCRAGSSPANGWTDDYDQPGGAAPYERLGLAFALIMTNPGIPLIYYGDEIGLAGGGDPDNRRLMPWNDTTLAAPQLALRDLIADLGRIRAENPVLGRGRRITRSSSADTWVFSMVGCGSGSPDVTVAVNRADTERTVQIPAGDYEDLLDGGAAARGGAVSLPPRGLLVWRSATDE
jgi:glycosidase